MPSNKAKGKGKAKDKKAPRTADGDEATESAPPPMRSAFHDGKVGTEALEAAEKKAHRTGLDCPEAPWGPAGVYERCLRARVVTAGRVGLEAVVAGAGRQGNALSPPVRVRCGRPSDT